jgi:hypothetical protein
VSGQDLNPWLSEYNFKSTTNLIPTFGHCSIVIRHPHCIWQTCEMWGQLRTIANVTATSIIESGKTKTSCFIQRISKYQPIKAEWYVYVPATLIICKSVFFICGFCTILGASRYYFLKQHQTDYLCNGEVLCFLCGMDWILQHYLDECRLRKVNPHNFIKQ